MLSLMAILSGKAVNIQKQTNMSRLVFVSNSMYEIIPINCTIKGNYPTGAKLQLAIAEIPIGGQKELCFAKLVKGFRI